MPRNTESASTTPEPPHASSWATPPEFYCDENITTRSVRRLLVGLGYVVHSPAELFGSRTEALGAWDETWLQKVAGTSWAVLNRDANIMRRPTELEAYRRAGVHMFYLPGQARSLELVELLASNLTEVCVAATSRPPRLWEISARQGLRELSNGRRRRR